MDNQTVHPIETPDGEVLDLGSYFLVRSRSQSDSWHTVRAGACDCKGFLFRRTCRHVDAVRALPKSPAADRDTAILKAETMDESGLFLPERPRKAKPASGPTFESIFGLI